jgi:hypothetical protein
MGRGSYCTFRVTLVDCWIESAAPVTVRVKLCGSAMSPEWHAHALALIAEAEKPSANVHFVFLLPLRSLVMAVKE